MRDDAVAAANGRSSVLITIVLVTIAPVITPQALEKAVDAWRAAGKPAEAEKTLNKLKSRYPEYQLHKPSNSLASP